MMGKRATLVAIGLMAEACLGCGSSAIQQGAPDARAMSDSGAYRDVAVASDSHDATDEGFLDAAGPGDSDGASCGAGNGTVVVTLGVPNVSTGGCQCNWSATGADASASGGSADNGFTVCLPAGPNYHIDCSCDNDPSDMAMFGPCEGSADFSVAAGVTTEVPVSVDCPG